MIRVYDIVDNTYFYDIDVLCRQEKFKTSLIHNINYVLLTLLLKASRTDIQL